jgi:hypothetical protein
VLKRAKAFAGLRFEEMKMRLTCHHGQAPALPVKSKSASLVQTAPIRIARGMGWFQGEAFLTTE